MTRKNQNAVHSMERGLFVEPELLRVLVGIGSFLSFFEILSFKEDLISDILKEMHNDSFNTSILARNGKNLRVLLQESDKVRCVVFDCFKRVLRHFLSV